MFFSPGARQPNQDSSAVGKTQRALNRAKCEAIDKNLKEWLMTLRLPELEEQTKPKAAARQLRIVLVEKLMRGPWIR